MRIVYYSLITFVKSISLDLSLSGSRYVAESGKVYRCTIKFNTFGKQYIIGTKSTDAKNLKSTVTMTNDDNVFTEFSLVFEILSNSSTEFFLFLKEPSGGLRVDIPIICIHPMIDLTGSKFKIPKLKKERLDLPDLEVEDDLFLEKLSISNALPNLDFGKHYERRKMFFLEKLVPVMDSLLDYLEGIDANSIMEKKQSMISKIEEIKDYLARNDVGDMTTLREYEGMILYWKYTLMS
jgi:hypothetical protein